MNRGDVADGIGAGARAGARNQRPVIRVGPVRIGTLASPLVGGEERPGLEDPSRRSRNSFGRGEGPAASVRLTFQRETRLEVLCRRLESLSNRFRSHVRNQLKGLIGRGVLQVLCEEKKTSLFTVQDAESLSLSRAKGSQEGQQRDGKRGRENWFKENPDRLF